MKNILEIKHLKKYYGKIRGVEDVSISLKEGEVFGFIGPNGAGKSTTIRSVMNMLNKTEGTVTFLGKPLDKTHRTGVWKTLYEKQNTIVIEGIGCISLTVSR